MGTGFLLMIASAYLMYLIAEADERRGWLWFGITLCITVGISRSTSLGILAIFLGFLVSFMGMFVANIYQKRER